jgi:hypothetical protein
LSGTAFAVVSTAEMAELIHVLPRRNNAHTYIPVSECARGPHCGRASCRGYRESSGQIAAPADKHAIDAEYGKISAAARLDLRQEC